MEVFIGAIIVINVMVAIGTVYHKSTGKALDLPNVENTIFEFIFWIFVFPGVLVGLLIFYLIVGPIILLVKKIDDEF